MRPTTYQFDHQRGGKKHIDAPTLSTHRAKSDTLLQKPDKVTLSLVTSSKHERTKAAAITSIFASRDLTLHTLNGDWGLKKVEIGVAQSNPARLLRNSNQRLPADLRNSCQNGVGRKRGISTNSEYSIQK